MSKSTKELKKEIKELKCQYNELSDYTNKIKADAVMDFVNMMIGAFDSGFVDKNNPNLSQIYQVARSHVRDSFHIEAPSIIEALGEVIAVSCGLIVKKKMIDWSKADIEKCVICESLFIHGDQYNEVDGELFCSEQCYLDRDD